MSDQQSILFEYEQLAKIIKLNEFNFPFVISSSDFTHHCVLQQRDVGPLLFRGNAVDHPEGKERLKHVPYSVMHVPVGLGIDHLCLKLYSLTRTHMFLST